MQALLRILNRNNDYELRKALVWVVMTIPAMEAEVKVAKTPETSADKANREISPPRLGANSPRIPI
jgi:hypothetical protein